MRNLADWRAEVAAAVRKRESAEAEYARANERFRLARINLVNAEIDESNAVSRMPS